MTVREAVSFLAASVQIRCLALMALAQGISTNLIDVRSVMPTLASRLTAHAAGLGYTWRASS